MEGHRDRSSWLCRAHRAILRNIICHFRGETEVPQCQCQENGLGMRKAGLLLNPQTITSHRTGVGSTANNSKAAQELRNKLLTYIYRPRATPSSGIVNSLGVCIRVHLAGRISAVM